MAWAGHALAQVGGIPVGNYPDFALDDIESTLTDPDDPILRRWTDNNVENIAQIVSVNRRGRYATVRLASARMVLNIPLGWYAVDDGERGAVFTPDEAVRIIGRQVDLPLEQVRSIEEYSEIKRAQMVQRYPMAAISGQPLGPGVVMNVYLHIPARPNDKGPRAIYEVVSTDPADPKRAQLTTMGCPDGQEQKYLPLLGLVLRDRRIEW